MYRYLIVIEKTEGNYSAYSPDLPGCVATGKTREEAEEKMQVVIETHVRGLSKTASRCPSRSRSRPM
ncbi:type II toxin-antitoxin system HicB family antitoxin [Methanofollis sp.]|uniref:type II toxin-antitoxin system HicB family antitoxin n=1 Tax=Methanofollis sp. TaxID=2052835 RepID=UPI00345882E2